MTQNNRTRFLKISSESDFAALSAKSRLAVTKPGEDEDGWDFLLQFPPNKNPKVSLDKQAPPIKCLVQIKATDNFDKMASFISVSCLDQLARGTLPAFIVFYDYANLGNPKNIYVCHLDKERMELILTKVRLLDSKGKKRIHRHNMKFVAKLADKIDTKLENIVMDTIVKHTGYDLAAYSANKIFLMKTLGFEDKPIVFRFATSTKIASLVDAMLGIGEMRITEATISEKRFGIEITDHEMQAGILTVQPVPVGKCQICCMVPETGNVVEVEADVIAPQIPGLPRDYFKLRIIAPGIDATIEDKKGIGQIQIKILPEDVFTFDSLLRVSSLSAALCGKGAMLDFKKDGRIFAKAAMSHLQEDRYHKMLAGRLEILDKLLSRSNFRGELYMRPGDMIEDKEFKWLAMAASSEEEQEISWKHDVEVPLHLTDGVVAVVMTLKCKDHYLCFFCWWKGSFRCEGFDATATISEPKIYRTLLVCPEDVEALQSRIEEFREFCAKPSKALVFLGPDPTRLFEETDDHVLVIDA